MFRKCDFSPFFGTNFWQIYTFSEDNQIKLQQNQQKNRLIVIIIPIPLQHEPT